MERSTPPIPRKLVEAFCRRFWVLLIPVVAVPALVVFAVRYTDTYESVATAWVKPAESLIGSSQPAYGAGSAAALQAQTLNDLLATQAFRTAVAAEAGLVEAGTSVDMLDAAAETLAGRTAAVELGPNLVGIKASAPTAAEAQRIAAAIVTVFQARISTEGAAQTQTVLAYYAEQVAAAQAQVDATRAELAVYTKANPGVEKIPDGEYLRYVSNIETQQRLLDRLLQGQQDAQFAALAVGGANNLVFTLQDAASLPAAPLGISAAKRYGPPVAGVVGGLLIAGAYLYIAYRADHTVRSAADLEGLHVAVLGSVPELRPLDAARRYTPLRWAPFVRRDYARRVAASISPLPDRTKAAS